MAQALKVERNWLIHGMGEVQGEAPIVEHPDDGFVAISSVAVRPSMGGGHLVEHEPVDGRPYHFQRSGKPAASTALPQPAKVNQNVPKNSAPRHVH